MRSLLIGDVCDRYLLEFVSEILSKRQGCDFDILATGSNNADCIFRRYNDQECKVYVAGKSSNIRVFGKHVGKIWKSFFAYSICKKYDEIIVYNVDLLSFAVRFFSKRKARIVLCYMGSDLLRANSRKLRLLKSLVRKSSVVVVENEHMKTRFEEKYGPQNAIKVRLAHYGTTNVDSMIKYCKEVNSFSREDFGISEKKVTIYIGYNGGRSQRHIEVIRSIQTLSKEEKNRIFLVLHCAYGLDSSYEEELRDTLHLCGIESIIVKEYMTGNKLASFRSCADIMINWQPSDCMSASMVESMELGVVVINGSWLVYPDIINYGGYYVSADDEKDLLEKLVFIINNISEYKVKTVNNKGILSILRWNKKEWSDALD